MSLAAETREAARARPFVLDALRAGVLNHSAAAAWLAEEADLGGDGDADADAIATALRRFREELPPYATTERAASVSMRSGVGVVDGPEADGSGDADPLLRVGGAAVVSEGRDTAILATGDVAGGGIDSDREGVTEPIFGCHVPHPDDRYEWFEGEAFGEHAFAEFGVVVDDALRPMGEGGTPEFSNLRAAGAVIGGYDYPAEKSASGVSIATGYATGRRAAREG